LALAQAGASICVVQRHPSPGAEPNMNTVNAIRALGANAQVVYCDLGNLDSVRELFPKALELMGGNIHILVNCAGIQRRSPSVDFPEKDWDDVGYPLKFCLTSLASDSQYVYVSLYSF
jgi:2-deoxy-D-gluconate 3-dehydrogenase